MLTPILVSVLMELFSLTVIVNLLDVLEVKFGTESDVLVKIKTLTGTELSV